MSTTWPTIYRTTFKTVKRAKELNEQIEGIDDLINEIVCEVHKIINEKIEI